MRLVCMADTHMFHADFKGETAVPDGDVLVHAGDMGRAGDEDELTEVAAWLASLPHRHKIVVAGNHDFLFEQEPDKARALFSAARGFTYLEDSACTIEGVTFYGSPWTPVFYDWAFMLPPGEKLAEKWALIPPHGVDVLITHGPPHGVLDDARRYRDGDGTPDKPPRHVGCEALRDRVAVVKPRVHVFGHIHNNGGVVEQHGTRFVNCTTNESEAPPIVVDL
jgi:Icc-related predicted phosphoesterase